MPDAVIQDVSGTQVLVLQKNFGGNVPMFPTWAWIWGPKGPIRLDVDAAIDSAIHSLGPAFNGYNSGLDWETLTCRTGVWEGEWPGKIGVGKEMEATFEISGGRLVVKDVKVRNLWDPLRIPKKRS